MAEPQHVDTPIATPVRPWLLPAMVVGALVAGIGIGAAVFGAADAKPTAPATVTVAASPAAPETVYVTPAPAKPSTVTVTASPPAPVTRTVTASPPEIITSVVSSECLRALELADEALAVAREGSTVSNDLVVTVTDGVDAIRRGNFGRVGSTAEQLAKGSDALNGVTSRMNGLVPKYDAAKAACRPR